MQAVYADRSVRRGAAMTGTRTEATFGWARTNATRLYLIQAERPAVHGGRESDHFQPEPRAYDVRGHISGNSTRKIGGGLAFLPSAWSIPHVRPDSRPPTHPPKGGHQKREPPALEPAHRGRTGRQVDGTTRARTRRIGVRGHPPTPDAGNGDARCKEIPRPSGRRTRHIPHGTHARRTNRDTPALPGGFAPVGQTGFHAPFCRVRWPVRPRARMGNPRRSRRGGCHAVLFVLLGGLLPLVYLRMWLPFDEAPFLVIGDQ